MGREQDVVRSGAGGGAAAAWRARCRASMCCPARLEVVAPRRPTAFETSGGRAQCGPVVPW